MQASALDTSAMVAYVNNEPGGVVVEALLDGPDSVCYAHAVNLSSS